MSARWTGPKPPPTPRDSADGQRRPAGPSVGRRTGRAIAEGLIVAAVLIGLLAVLWITVHTTP